MNKKTLVIIAFIGCIGTIAMPTQVQANKTLNVVHGTFSFFGKGEKQQGSLHGTHLTGDWYMGDFYPNGKPPSQWGFWKKHGIIGDIYDSSDVEVVVYPNPSGIGRDVNVRISARTGESLPINGSLEVYYLQDNNDVVLIHTLEVVQKESNIYTISSELLRNPGIYNIVGRFYYLDDYHETNFLIMRVEHDDGTGAN